MKKIIFCTVGKSFSGAFFDYWNILRDSWQGEFIWNRAYDPVVYYARNKCLCGSTLGGPKQPVFYGMDYDYIMWTDSDIIPNSSNWYYLMQHDTDIVSGLYKMADGKNYATVPKMDDEYFLKNGHYKFLDDNNLKNHDKNKLLSVDYTGLGYMLIKKGVFEKIGYPWFSPIWKDFGNDIKEFTSEDVGFCVKAKKAGFDIFVDPKVIVNHEKECLL